MHYFHYLANGGLGRLCRGAVVSASLTLTSLAWCQSSELIDQARDAIRSANFERAYELLEPVAEAIARDVEGNYLLGVAALETGKPGAAQMAFERALILNPDFLPARAELARANLALGDLEGARREAATVAAANPPPGIRSSLDRIVAQADSGQLGERGVFKLTGYVQGELGHDSNINAAASSRTVELPIFGNLPFTLAPLLTAQRSAFAGVGGGLALTNRFSEAATFFLTGDIKFRENFQQSAFAPLSYGAVTGVQFSFGVDRYSVGASVSGFRIGTRELDRRRGLFASWSRDLGQRDRVEAFGQYLDNEFPQDRTQDTQTYLVGGTWAHAFNMSGNPVLRTTAFYGHEPQRNADVTVGRNYVGARMGGEYTLQEGLRIVGGVSASKARYGGVSAFFLTKRREARYEFDIGIAWKPDRLWTITPQFIFTRNDSSIALTDFDRKQFLVVARRDFQ